MSKFGNYLTAAGAGAASAALVVSLAFATNATPPPTPEPTETVAAPSEAPAPVEQPVTPPAEPVAPAESTPVEEVPPAEPEPEPEIRVEDIGGTMRWVSKSKWELIDNATHTPYGVDRVQVMKDRVRVFFSFKASEVRSFNATVDEAYASANVRVGPSVGLSYADIFIYMGTNKKPVNPALLSKSGANIWFTGSFVLPPA